MDERADIESIRARCSQSITEIVDNPREYYRVQQILRDRAALLAAVDRLQEENRRLLTGDRVVYFPCKEHMGLPFTMTVGFAPPTMCKCPICEPPPSPLSAGSDPC